MMTVGIQNNTCTEKTNNWKMELEKLIMKDVITVNGDVTEEALNSIIMKEVASHKIKSVEGFHNIEDTKEDTRADKIEPNGVWIYVNGSIQDWVFNRYDTVSRAVCEAVKYIDAQIICNGNIIEYDSLSDEEAYYIDSETNSAVMVKIQ